MANPRQRRKARSSAPRNKTTNAKSLRKKPTVRGPATLRKNWDVRRTVRQNYARLGLLPRLNDINQSNPTGLSSDLHADATEASRIPGALEKGQATSNAPNEPSTSTAAPTRGIRMARIVRDPEGNIVDMEEQNQEVDELIASDIPNASGGISSTAPKTKVVKELEDLAAQERNTPKPLRAASAHQVKWLADLVAKHGSDIRAMARDRKLNVYQHTEGQLRRQLNKTQGRAV